MSDWTWSAADLARLSDFLADRGLTTGRVTTTRIGDGHSNLTYLVGGDDGHRVVVRRPPPPPTPPGAHDMLREARLIAALADSAVPVPAVLATADAGEVIDVHLYAMSVVDGPVVTGLTPAPLDDPDVRRRLGETLVDTLADLHAVDWRSAGLEDFGRPEGFNARHLDRIGGLVADEHGAPPAQFAVLHEWLSSTVPPESGAAVVHNDFRLGNVVLSAEQPGTVAAVLDWELATVGDPLFDLGYFLASVPAEPPHTPTQELGLAMLEDGWPTRAELAERYARRTGADLTRLPWYAAMAQWKLAVLYEYGRRRAVRGVGDPYYADPVLVRAFLDAAHREAGLPPASHPSPEKL